MSIHHWHAAQWIAAVWMLIGYSGVLLYKKRTAQVGNFLACTIWLVLLIWGGFFA